jgi:hypothetical protein
VSRVARELRVKPEEVVEMETRLSGQEIAFEADADDESAYARRTTRADHDAEPLRVLEAKESEQTRDRRPADRAEDAWTPAAAASSRRAGCARRTPRPCTSSPPSSRSRRAHPPDRGEGVPEDAQALPAPA